MSVRRHGHISMGIKQAASHSEVNEKLAGGGFAAWAFEVKDDVLANAMNPGDAEASESGGDDVGCGLEGLAGTAARNRENTLAVGAVVDALGDGFDFGEFGHGVDLVSHCGGGWTWAAGLR